MLNEPALPGLKYDVGKAAAIADAMDKVIKQTVFFEVTVPDQLAAVGIIAARAIAGSRLRTNARLGADALAAFIVEYVGTLTTARGQGA